MKIYDYGNLERYLGQQYAEDLQNCYEMGNGYEDESMVLENSMQVMAMYSHVNLALHGRQFMVAAPR